MRRGRVQDWVGKGGRVKADVSSLTQADKGAEVREEGPALISLSGLHSLAEGAAE